MQADEIAPVEGHNRAILRNGERRHLLIGNFLICVAGFQARQHIMPRRPQRFDDGAGKIFVGIKTGRPLRVLLIHRVLLGDVSFDFRRMEAIIIPRRINVIR